MSERDDSVPTRSKGRSPGYPAITLDLAIERARTLFRKDGRSPATIPVIQEHWGMKPDSGAANVTVAALKRFGLLADEGRGGQRRAHLTNLALDILLVEGHDDARFLDLVQQAALLPTIHRELWEKHDGSLPSDGNLKHELVLVRNFTETGAADFIAQLRKTLRFARLDRGAGIPGPLGQRAPVAESHEPLLEDVSPAADSQPSNAARPITTPLAPTPHPSMPSTAVTIPILLPGAAPVHLTGQFPISEGAWKQLMTVLEAMKAGLVDESSG